jgi:hypothetical protein
MSDQTKPCGAKPGEGCPGRNALLIVAGLLAAGVLAAALVRFAAPAPIDSDRDALRARTLAELRAANADALTHYAWQDEGKGIVRLPVDRALELVLTEWKNPEAGRAALIAREEKAAAPAPKPAEKPSQFE